MKKLLLIVLVVHGTSYAGRIEQQYFKDAVALQKSKNLAAGVYAGLDNTDKQAVDKWYKETNKESLGKLPAVGGAFSFPTDKKTPSQKLDHIRDVLLEPALTAVAVDQNGKDAVKGFATKATNISNSL